MKTRMYAHPLWFRYAMLPAGIGLGALVAPSDVRAGRFTRPTYANRGVHRPVNVRGPRVTRQFPVPV